jgi:hypothetical protein
VLPQMAAMRLIDAGDAATDGDVETAGSCRKAQALMGMREQYKNYLGSMGGLRQQLEQRSTGSDLCPSTPSGPVETGAQEALTQRGTMEATQARPTIMVDERSSDARGGWRQDETQVAAATQAGRNFWHAMSRQQQQQQQQQQERQQQSPNDACGGCMASPSQMGKVAAVARLRKKWFQQLEQQQATTTKARVQPLGSSAMEQELAATFRSLTDHEARTVQLGALPQLLSRVGLRHVQPLPESLLGRVDGNGALSLVAWLGWWRSDGKAMKHAQLVERLVHTARAKLLADPSIGHEACIV